MYMYRSITKLCQTRLQKISGVQCVLVLYDFFNKRYTNKFYTPEPHGLKILGIYPVQSGMLELAVCTKEECTNI